MTPRRVQLSRRPGARLPEGCKRVDRSTIYGNHAHRVPVGLVGVERLQAQGEAARAFRRDLTTSRCIVPQRGSRPPFVLTIERIVTDLAGADLACWCGLGEPCHADVLLELANPANAEVVNGR